MSSFYFHYLLFFSLLLTHFTSFSSSASSYRPNALVLPISKDQSSNQYTTKLIQRTPSVTLHLTLDLGTQFLWVLCGKRYVSSTYHPVSCNTPQCTLANSKICNTCPGQPKPGCNNNTCRTPLKNLITNVSSLRGGELATDVLRLNSTTDGSNPYQLVTIPKYLFVCAPKSLLQGLAKGVSGIAGLGRSKISLPSQFSSTFKFPPKFVLCLSSFPKEDGYLLFGNGPYNFSNIDVTTTNLVSYTPLIHNPTRPSDYFIGVTGIKILDDFLAINKSLLAINSMGKGGTMLSLVHPYTSLESSIYKKFIIYYDSLMRKLYPRATPVTPVAPFEKCYNSNGLSYTRIGPYVPDINLVLQDKNVSWRIQAMNSLVNVDSNGTSAALMLCMSKEVPWYLDDGTGRVFVLGARGATGLELTVGSEVFEESGRSLVRGTLDYLQGLKMLGVKRTERVLPTGTPLTVVGEAIKDDVGTVRIQRPHKGPFYVSPKTIDQLIANLGKWARLYKYASLGFTVFGVYLIAKHALGLILEKRRRWEMHKRVLDAAAKRTGQDYGKDESGSDSAKGEGLLPDLCVICLEQEYNAVFVPCGHMCCCTACSSQLSNCPLCRRRIEQVVRTFRH